MTKSISFFENLFCQVLIFEGQSTPEGVGTSENQYSRSKTGIKGFDDI